MNISRYEQRNFQGIDTDLATSLHEYGMIWKEYKINTKNHGRKGEFLVIFGCNFDEEKQKYTTKDHGYYTKQGILDETWIAWDRVASYAGQTEQDFRDQDFGLLMTTLVGYYGKENFC